MAEINDKKRELSLSVANKSMSVYQHWYKLP